MSSGTHSADSRTRGGRQLLPPWRVACGLVMLLLTNSFALAQNKWWQPSTNPAATRAATTRPTSVRHRPASSRPAFDEGDDFASWQSALDTENASELMLYRDMPVVISAARQEQPLNLSAVPVDVVTSDEIHYSGLTTLPDVLNFVPGVDVTRIDRNNYAVGIHGMDNAYADRTLTLINGRDATNPLFGGTDWVAMPVFMEDIDRIEVVRGPGGAAWGANAFNGVINIITKDPAQSRGILASSTVDEYGDTYSQMRWADVSGPWSWRISLGYEDRVSSSDAIGDPDVRLYDRQLAVVVPVDDSQTHDQSRNFRSDSQIGYHFSSQTSLTAGIATADVSRGDLEAVGYQPDYNGFDVMTRTFVRLDVKPSDTSSGYVQWYTNTENADRPSIARYWNAENDLEGQYAAQLANAHKVTIGADLRLTSGRVLPTNPPALVVEDRINEQWGGGYIIDRWQMAKRLALEGQIRLDDYSAIGADWSGRISTLYSFDDADHNVLRLSAARAYRSPLDALRDLSGTRDPLPGNMDLVNFTPNENLTNETVRSLEAGYTSQLGDGLLLRANTFYQRYDNLVVAPNPLPDPYDRVFIQLDNLGGAESYGGELELSYTRRDYQVSAWYGYDHYYGDQEQPSIRAFFPPDNSAGVSALWHIGDHWTLNGNYRFSGKVNTPAMPPEDQVNSYNLIDLALTKEIWQERASITLGVNDVLDQLRHGAFEDGSFTAHDLPGRTFFARFQVRF